MQGVPSFAAELALIDDAEQQAALDADLEDLGKEIDALEDDIETIETPFQRLGDISRIYVSFENGNDDNSGLDSESAVKTFAGVERLITLNRPTEINIEGTLRIDSRSLVYGNSQMLHFRGRTPDAKIEFSNGENAGFTFLFGASVTMAFRDLEIVDDRTDSGGGFVVSGFVFYNFLNVSFNRTAQAVAANPTTRLFRRGSFCAIQASGLILDDSAGGVLIDGLAAGDNPNDSNRFVSNVSAL